MIFIYLILTAIVRSCEPDQIKVKEFCQAGGYEWKNDQCVKKKTVEIVGDATYCSLQNLTKCAADTSCALYNGVCENFIGCQVYPNSSCSQISVNCNSIPGQSVCQDKPSGCGQISQKECGYLDHKYGAADSCEWNEQFGTCLFKGCNNYKASSYSDDSCKLFYANCKYNGISCVDNLNICDLFQKQDCASGIASTGKCKYLNGNCVAEDCYVYSGYSVSECNKYYNQQGSQCTYDKDVGDICLEPNYREKIEECFNSSSYLNCTQDKNKPIQLTLWDCFKGHGNSKLTLCYSFSECQNQDPVYCEEAKCKKEANQEKYCILSDGKCKQVDDCRTKMSSSCDPTLCRLKEYQELKKQKCEEIQFAPQCSKATTPSLRKCFWDSNTQTCQTLYYCSQINWSVTKEICSYYGCKWISKINSNYCIEIMSCQFYYSQEQCISNQNSQQKLSDNCIWVNNVCRESTCEDQKEKYQCEIYSEDCVFSKNNNCISKKKENYKQFKNDQCNLNHLVFVNGQCTEVSPFTVYSFLNTTTAECKLYSRNLISNGRSCILNTHCENFSLRDCEGMRDFEGFYCIESNSQCKRQTDCKEIKKSSALECFQIDYKCTSDGKNCIDALFQCSDYTDEIRCSFQGDSSKCIWRNDICSLIQCSDLIANIKDCDSRNLCMNPLECYPNQCIYNKRDNHNPICHAIKSKCYYYSESDCTKSVEGFCYWNNVSCQQLFDCSQIKLQQICTQAYLKNYCQYKNYQCENVTCQNSENSIIRQLSDYFSCSYISNETICTDQGAMLYNNTCYSCQNQTYSSYCMGINMRPLKEQVKNLFY